MTIWWFCKLTICVGDQFLKVAECDVSHPAGNLLGVRSESCTCLHVSELRNRMIKVKVSNTWTSCTPICPLFLAAWLYLGAQGGEDLNPIMHLDSLRSCEEPCMQQIIEARCFKEAARTVDRQENKSWTFLRVLRNVPAFRHTQIIRILCTAALECSENVNVVKVKTSSEWDWKSKPRF